MEYVEKVGWAPEFYDAELELLKEKWTLESVVALPDVAIHLGQDVSDYTFRNIQRPAVTLTIGSFTEKKAWEHLYFTLVDSANVFLQRS